MFILLMCLRQTNDIEFEIAGRLKVRNERIFM